MQVAVSVVMKVSMVSQLEFLCQLTGDITQIDTLRSMIRRVPARVCADFSFQCIAATIEN